MENREIMEELLRFLSRKIKDSRSPEVIVEIAKVMVSVHEALEDSHVMDGIARTLYETATMEDNAV